MVKNFGGNKSKKQGRKFVSSNNSHKLRIPEDEDEVISCVTKMLGNGMCNVKCSDGMVRLCIIRNKFRGRSKRDNTLNPGSYVLVGKRSWESGSTVKSNMEKCDLMEVYGTSEIDRIRDTLPSVNWSVFRSALQHVVHDYGSNPTKEKEGEDMFQFQAHDTSELQHDVINDAKTHLDTITVGDLEEEIIIDDI